MKIVLLAVLLVVGKAFAPVPRQASDNSARSSQQVKQQSNSKQTPSTDASPVPNISRANEDQSKRATPPKADTQETIFITEPAAVAVTGKDWWDKAYVVFTGLLVGIGAVGVRYAIKTLGAIERQAKANEDTLAEIKIAGKQTDQMIEHAGKQADAALLSAQIFKNVERPWILIFSEKMPDCEASALFAKNCGKTPARLVLSSKNNWLLIKSERAIGLEAQRPNYGTVSPLYEPIIILPDESTYILSVTEWDVSRECESEERLASVKEGTLDLYIFGKIVYQDLLSTGSDSLHETAWCCHYLRDSPNCLSMFGLPGYTYHT